MDYSVTKKKEDYRAWICAVLLFVITFPKWFWGFGANLIVFASLLLLLVAHDDISRNKRGKGLGLLAVLFQLVIIWVTYITDATNINGYVIMFLQAIGFSTLFLCSVDFWKKCVDCFIKLLAVLLPFALVEHVLISFIGIDTTSPYTATTPLNPDREYFAYVFNVYLQKSFDYFNRFYAFYDEPGVLGNILMVMLYIQKFNFKKWYNIVILVSGIMSFSLAFYIAVAAYYVLFGNKEQKMVFATVAIIATYYFYSNEYIYDYVFGRLEFQNGQMAGYNRERHGDFQYWIKTVPVVDYLFWGYQPRESVPYAASWKWAFALWGIVPSFIYLFTIIYPRAKHLRHKSDILLGLVLTVIIWIQRPFVYQYLYAFLIVIPFIYLGSTETKKQLATNKVPKS